MRPTANIQSMMRVYDDTRRQVPESALAAAGTGITSYAVAKGHSIIALALKGRQRIGAFPSALARALPPPAMITTV
jgi:hypothetical protein